MRLLQSSSMSVQRCGASARGPTEPLQMMAPLVHDSVPGEQKPTHWPCVVPLAPSLHSLPGEPSGQRVLAGGCAAPSSTTKLQSSSRPLHTSAGKVHALLEQSTPVSTDGNGHRYWQPALCKL